MRAPKQNIKNNISDLEAFCDSIWFFVIQGENAGKTNNRMKSKEHNYDKAGKKQWSTTTAKKHDITTKLRKQGWMTYSQRRRYMKTKSEHKKTTWKNTPSPKKGGDNQKKPCFSLFFGHPFGVPKSLENKFPKKKHQRVENGPKIENMKSENPIFPSFWWKKTEELIGGPGGGISLIELGRSRRLWTLFFRGPVSKVVQANNIIWQK